jgi:hypothetical protein
VRKKYGEHLNGQNFAGSEFLGKFFAIKKFLIGKKIDGDSSLSLREKDLGNGLGDRTKFSDGVGKGEGRKGGSKKIRVNLDLGEGGREGLGYEQFEENLIGSDSEHAGGLLCKVARDSKCDGPKIGSLGSCYLQALYSLQIAGGGVTQFDYDQVKSEGTTLFKDKIKHNKAPINMLVKKGFVETENYVKGQKFRLTKKGQSAAKRHKDLYQ